MDAQRWQRSYAPGVPISIDYEQVTISQIATRSCQRFGDQDALNFMGLGIRYAELDKMANRFAQALSGLGVGPGTRVAVCLPNIPQVVIANLAVWRLGAVVVLCNPLYTDRELKYQLSDSGAELLVTVSLLVPRATRLMESTGVERIVACHIHSYLPFLKRMLFPFVRKKMVRRVQASERVSVFKDLVQEASDEALEDRSRMEELATIIYTGGTTGESKGVMLSHANMSYNVQQLMGWLPDLPDGGLSLIGTFPVFHSAGLTTMQNLTLAKGWTHHMIPRPEPKALLEILQRAKPDFLPGVPTIFIDLLANEQFRNADLSFIKGFFSGAAPLAKDTIRALKDLTGATMCEVYGLTETSPAVSATPWGGTIKPGTVGLPLPDTQIKIVDGEGKQLEPGQAGEILIRGPQTMMGYCNKPEQTAQVMRDGWFCSGDIGSFDEDGYLTILDRQKDMIIAGGYNIYPVEIDGVLAEHPKVLQACAVGVADEKRGETVKAFVVVKPGQTVSEEELDAHCRASLAAYKVPKQYQFIDELPTSAVGKVLRRKLRDLEKE